MHVYIPFEIPLRSISPPPSTGYQFFQPSSLISASPFLKNAGSVRNRTATGSQFATCFNTYIDTYVYCRMRFEAKFACNVMDTREKACTGSGVKGLILGLIFMGLVYWEKKLHEFHNSEFQNRERKKGKGKELITRDTFLFFSYRKTKSSSFHRVYRRLPKSKD